MSFPLSTIQESLSFTKLLQQEVGSFHGAQKYVHATHYLVKGSVKMRGSEYMRL